MLKSLKYIFVHECNSLKPARVITSSLVCVCMFVCLFVCMYVRTVKIPYSVGLPKSILGGGRETFTSLFTRCMMLCHLKVKLYKMFIILTIFKLSLSVIRT